jgi:hypothetical protein
MSSTACDDQFAPETEPHHAVAVCARTYTSDQVLTGNYLQINADCLEKECRLARERGNVVCVWVIDSENVLHPSCGEISQFLCLDTPNSFKFCPFCGKPIRIK